MIFDPKKRICHHGSFWDTFPMRVNGLAPWESKHGRRLFCPLLRTTGVRLPAQREEKTIYRKTIYRKIIYQKIIYQKLRLLRVS